MMANSDQKLCNRMRLWEFPDQYVVEPSDGSDAQLLSVSRANGSINLLDELPQANLVRVPQAWTIFGIVGILKLIKGSYLFLIMERECVGYYMGFPIFKIISLKVFPCNESVKSAPDEQRKMENELSGFLHMAERTLGLYFSYDVNITLSVQQLHDLGDDTKLLPLWRQIVDFFGTIICWKHSLIKVTQVDPYILPVMQGSFQCFQTAIGNDSIAVTLIARRCNRRNETEQVIQMNGYTAAFVQVRGSIPLLWAQNVDLRYSPKFEILKLENLVVERHFLDLRKKYGKIFIANLVNKHGGEGSLCEKYASAVKDVANDGVRYLHFDFHKICGSTDYRWLSILYHQVEAFLHINRFFLLNEKGEKVQHQLGVVRTNCIDCLDRTNVTQSMIAHKMLELQVRRIGVFSARETLSQHPDFYSKYKILWANHGDDISIQYTGTPALKGDYVRHGVRTSWGIANDGWNSLMRYYLNNFCDGTRQDAIDLLQGHYIISSSTPQIMTHKTKKTGIEAIATIRFVVSLIILGFVFALISLRKVRHDRSNLLFSIVWASLSIFTASLVIKNGRIFCNRPRLHQPSHHS